MNVGKSVKVALAKQEKNVAWLSEQAGVTRQTAWGWSVLPVAGSQRIDKLAEIFKMTSAEFIALGEE